MRIDDIIKSSYTQAYKELKKIRDTKEELTEEEIIKLMRSDHDHYKRVNGRIRQVHDIE